MEWLRWYHGAVSDPKWPLIARKAGVSVGVVVSVWAALLEHASQDEERGSVDDFDGETIDALYGYADGTCAAVVAAMREKGIIAEGCICAWRKRQPRREDVTATERKRQQRSREKEALAQGVTPCHAHVTHGSHNVTTEQNREEQRREEEKTEEGGDTSPAPAPVSKPRPARQKKSEPPPKASYGEYQRVKLTADECTRLEGKYGADTLAAAITKLDLHIEAKGKDEYKCHAAALQKWVFTAVEQDRQRGRASPGIGSGGSSGGDNRTWAQKREAEVMREFLQGA